VVHGLIAEKYGLAGAARSTYERVKDGPDDDAGDPTRPSAYAQRRLKGLSATR
jgi:hypothetical protein